MKKISLFIIAIVFAINISYAQWTTSGSNINNTNTGNVGIGTTTPGSKLEVNGGITTNTTIVNIAANGLKTLGVIGSPAYNTIDQTAQTGGKLFRYGNTGAFALGTTWDIYNQTDNKGVFSVDYNGYGYFAGYLGIGVTTPVYPLDIAGAAHSYVSAGFNLVLSKSTGASISFDNGSGTQTAMLEAGTSDNHFEFFTNTATNTGIVERMRITNTGNLLINQTTQANSAYKLDVAGPVRANEIVVNTTGADFVFEPSYKLPSISFLKNYIDKNHHLPEIPSAKQMQADGLNVGENQVKLLQKVEELTLYLIEKDREIKAQQEDNKSLHIEMNKLKKQISLIKKH